MYKMNLLNILTRLYAHLRNYRGVPYWVMTPMRRCVRYAANKYLPLYLSKPLPLNGKTETGVVISFTSFPARIADVWQVVKSLKNQTVLPEKIILWLSKEQFPTKSAIPDSLWQEEDNLFEIRMVDEDIRSHKKFYYIMQEYPDKAFVTCDDDTYYHPETLKYLVEGSKKYPKCIIANTTRHICYDNDGNLLSYRQWKAANNPFSNDNLIQIGVGGVLYPPNSLHELTLRKDLFLELTPMADDIWLNCMARLKGTPVVQSAMKNLPLPIENNSPSLSSENKSQNKNDIQLINLRAFLLKEHLIDVYSAEFKNTL